MAAIRNTQERPERQSSTPANWAAVLPILLLIGLVQASVLLPGTLSRPVFFWISTGLLLTLPLFFWKHDPRSILPPALIYIASACFLTIAASESSELGLLLFLPIVGVALFGSRVQSGIAIFAVLIGSIVITLVADVSITEMARRTGLYFGISLVISVAIITFREPLVRSRKRAKLLLKDAQAINDMARRLAMLTEPASIKRTAAELAATVGSPPGSTWRRGSVPEGRTTGRCSWTRNSTNSMPMNRQSTLDGPHPTTRLVEQALTNRSGCLRASVEPRDRLSKRKPAPQDHGSTTRHGFPSPSTENSKACSA